MQLSSPKKRKFWLGMIVSALSLGGMFWLIKPSEIAEAVQKANLEYLLLTAVFLLLYLVLRVVRWGYLLGNQISLKSLFHIQNIGQMLTQLLPFRLGDVARAVLVGQQPGGSVAWGVSTMVVERLLDMLLMVLLLPLTLFSLKTGPSWLQQAALISGAGIVLLLGLLLFLANKRPLAHKIIARAGNYWPRLQAAAVQHQIDDMLKGVQAFSHWRSATSLAGLTLLTWLPVVLAYNAALKAVQLPHSLFHAAFLMIAGAFAVAAPSSPGQIGVFHVGVLAAMAALGFPAETAAPLAVLYHAVNFFTMVLVGVFGSFSLDLPLSGRSWKTRLTLEPTPQSLTRSHP